MIGYIHLLSCGKISDTRSAQDKIRDSLQVVGSGELDDDLAFPAALGDRHTRVIGVGERRHHAFTQGREGLLSAAPRRSGSLDLAEADDLLCRSHRQPFLDATERFSSRVHPGSLRNRP